MSDTSFNELEVIDHTDYITLTIQGNTINIAKRNWEYPEQIGEVLIINQVYQAIQNNSQLNIE